MVWCERGAGERVAGERVADLRFFSIRTFANVIISYHWPFPSVANRGTVSCGYDRMHALYMYQYMYAKLHS